MTPRRHVPICVRMRRVLLLALPLAACAQGPTLQEQLQAHVGKSELDLVTTLGVPVRTYEVEGRRFLQYEQRRSVLYQEPGLQRPFYGGPWGPRWGYVPGPAVVGVVGCDITFELREGRVQGFSYRGQGC